ncbi:putative VAS1-valyl-tRNA synthetase [Serendipita vermifera]|nr:putative VAS1-valyl-tRNA synthetase [Serendipita vermifera]
MSEAAPIPPESGQGKTPSKKDAKKAEKLAKFNAKTANKAAAAASTSDQKESKKDKSTPKAKQVEEPTYVNTTPPGQKKDMSQPMASGYNPIAVESAWYDWWNAQGYFKPQFDESTGKPKKEGLFVIPAPPPNVTGSLHIGHGLTVAIQDTLIRWNRMLGKTTLFVPGFDHAGISTQAVIEGRIWKLEGKTRHDYGREAFLEKVWAWKDEYQARITKQLYRLGGSYEWSRAAFTMDEARSKAVTENFCRLYEQGIIFRANRLVNWCVTLNTTLSNLELEKIECTGKKWVKVPGYEKPVMFGVITSFAYPIEGSDEKIIVATTRPETMLGDTAVAVHPKDPRYTHLHGKFVKHPFIPDRKMPIVLDDIVVDMEFGTGAVKITPAHDPNDYACGVRNKLEFINILNDDGTLNENAGERFKGMKRFDARGAVIAALKELDLFIETKDNAMVIPICAKSKDVIEPVLKPQWWVNSKPLAEEALARTRAGELKIIPKTSEAEWYSWLTGIQDWCISRQLWWGHRCPAYLICIEGEPRPDPADSESWVVGRTLEEATERATEKAAGRKFTLEQDEDVLDTWFSSALWPFSIQGWPEKTSDYELFYPATVLETGWDILFFWVARMVMLGLKLTGKMPFEEVICHAMIRDAHGRKMSKSLGNVIDPVDVIEGAPLEKLHEQLLSGNLPQHEIELAKKGQKADFPRGIPQCGTDALRFALCAYSSGGRDINLEINRVEGYRKFCNKVWNATRFAMLKLDGDFVPPTTTKPTGQETLVERWVYHKLNEATTDLNKALTERNFMAATTAAYSFWLYELCDVYIEAAKPLTENPSTRKSAQDTLYNCLDYGLRLLHPFMPFVTEELWQRLPRRAGDPTESIMMSSFPLHDPELVDQSADADFALIFNATRGLRSLASQYNLQKDVEAYILSSSDKEATILSSELETIKALTKNVKSLKVVRATADVPAGCGSSVLTSESSLHADVLGNPDINLDLEIQKAEEKLAAVTTNIEKLKAVQAKPDYEKTPESIRDANAEKLRLAEAELANLELTRSLFAKLKLEN